MYGFEKLNAWQKAMYLCEAIYKDTKSFPKEEVFGLVSQIRRAAVSVPLNIAEGSGCNTKKEFLRFLNIALRSLFETVTAVKLSFRLGFLSQATHERLLERCDEVGKLLNGLINSLKK